MIILSSVYRMMARGIGREERFEKDNRILVVDDPRKLEYFYKYYANKRDDVFAMMCPYEVMKDHEERERKDVLATKFRPGLVDYDTAAYEEAAIPLLHSYNTYSTPALDDAFRDLYDIRSKVIPSHIKRGLSPIFFRANSTYPTERHQHKGMVYGLSGLGTYGYLSEDGPESYEVPIKHLVVFDNRWWHGAPSHQQLAPLVTDEMRLGFNL